MWNRRQFMQTTGGALSLGMLASRARALGRKRAPRVAADAQFFLFVQVYGAWDVCLAFDPKDRDAKQPDGSPAFDQPYAMSDVRDYGNGIRLPPAGQVLGKYADRLMVVNGLDMEVDNGHFVDNMMAGLQQPRTSNLPWVQCLIAKHHPYVKRCSVPHLYTSYDGQFFGGPFESSSITATAGDFLAFLGPAMASDGGGLTGIEAMVGEYAAAQAQMDRRRAFSGYADAIDRAVQVGTALRNSGFTPPADATAPASLGNLLGDLFTAGVVGAATLSFGERYFFDTHSNHYRDHPLGKALTDLDTLLSALAAVQLDDHTSVLERTTVVVAAEFCRTPRLNAAAGKDHNIRSNSFAVIGHNTRPGVYGLSGYGADAGPILSSHVAQPIDFATGLPSATGQIMHARNLWAGFGGVCGVDLSTSFGSDIQPVTFFG